MTLIQSLVAAAKEAQLKQCRRKKAPAPRTETPATKKPSENSFLFLDQVLQNSEQQCFEEFVKFQTSLHKSINDAVQEQETSQKKVKLTSKPWRLAKLQNSCPRPSDGIVIREPQLQNSDPRPSNGVVIREPQRCDAEELQKPKSAKKIEKSHEERLKAEKPLKKPIVCNQETAPRKRKLDHNFEKIKNADSVKSLRPLSEEERMKIVQKAREGGEENVTPVLVIQKDLSRSDILRDQNRITIPVAQIENIFLSEEEVQYLQIKQGSRTNYFVVPIIEPSGRVPELNFRRWNVGKSSVSYVFNGGWKDMVAYNELEEGQTVQIWAFRVQGRLNFAFVLLSHHLPQQQQQKEQQQSCNNVVVVPMSASQALALINRHREKALCNNLVIPSAVASASATTEEGESSTSTSRDSEVRWAVDLNVDPREAMDACLN